MAMPCPSPHLQASFHLASQSAQKKGCLAISSVRLAVLTVYVTARDVQAVESHGGVIGAGDLLNVLDHLNPRDCIAPDM